MGVGVGVGDNIVFVLLHSDKNSGWYSSLYLPLTYTGKK